MKTDRTIAASGVLFASLCCAIPLSCTSGMEQDDESATLLQTMVTNDGGTVALVIRHGESTVTCCIDGRMDSASRGRLFTEAHPECPNARLVTRGDVKLIEAILRLDPADAPVEQRKDGPHNIIEEFQEKARETTEPRR